MPADPSAPDRRPPDRVCIIRPSALGDVCRTVPVLASLRRAWPDARIDWVVQDTFAEAISAHPDLTGVVPFPRSRFARLYRPGPAAELLGWLRGLGRPGYDAAIDAQGLARSGVMTLATRAPVRVGPADARELGWACYTKRVPRAGEHTVDAMLGLVAGLGVEPAADMRLYTREDWREQARELAAGGPWPVVIAPTSRWSAKQWPAERFARVAGALVAAGQRVAVVGSAGERGQIGPVLELAARERGMVDLTGLTSVGELMAVIEHSPLVLANDSAALHMAVGFSRPIVALYGPTRVERVGPFGRAGDVIQHTQPGDRYDHKDAHRRTMMERIGVDEVVEACMSRLGVAV